jgi:2,3,4,5-tetrahydropyridine-2,6-dicarboxylate N-succinyltransferase
MTTNLQATIEAAWANREALSPATQGAERAAMEAALDLLDCGAARIAERGEDGVWIVHQWLKQAVLLSFRMTPNFVHTAGDVRTGGFAAWWDKVPLKTQGWERQRFEESGFRMVPGAIVRRSAYIAPDVVLMPSFVNVGARVGPRTMVDTWSTIGSCAQIGADCHISGGVGIGGVLEPLQANPVIIEDKVFIGARSEVAEGVVVREGAVISMGVFLGASTKIVDRETGAVTRGEVPAYAVVVPGTLPDPKGGPSLACAVIVKRVDAQTRAKTGINELLRH